MPTAPSAWGHWFGGTPRRRRWAVFEFEAWLTDLGSYLIIIREHEERAYDIVSSSNFDDRRWVNGATPVVISLELVS